MLLKGVSVDNTHLEKAINDSSDVLKPVLQTAYQLTPASKIEVLQIAHDVNKNLGYELFDDLYYPRLVNDFAVVSRAMQHHSLLSK